jgi:hypothetical protein
MVRSEDLHGVFTRYETGIGRMKQIDYATAHRVSLVSTPTTMPRTPGRNSTSTR